MRILGIIVLYTPDKDALNNLDNLINSKYIDKVFIADNSATKLDLYESNSKVSYNFYSENRGIAYALHDGMEYAKANDYDYALTLDQDSKFPYDSFDSIKSYLDKYLNTKTGIVALNYNNKYKSKNGELKLKYIITSGNFINVKAYKEIDGFNRELFIDYVDFDLCRQFYYKKYDIVVLTNYSLIQTIGNPIYKRFLFVKLKSMNPSLIRYYYRFRNLTYCYKRNKRFYLKNKIKEGITIWIMLLCEKDKCKKLKMIKLGKKDGKRGILGPYKERM